MPRSHPLAPHRVIIGAVVAVLAVVALLFLRGPAFWQRLYYPLPDEYRADILASARRHSVNPYLIAAVIDAESDWHADTVSDAGAVGLMQLLPQTAQDVEEAGLVNLRDIMSQEEMLSSSGPPPLTRPAVNIEYGTAYLRLLVERYHEIEPAVAAYNAGMGNVDEWLDDGGDIREEIEFPETKHYVLRVMRARDVYERLYPDAFPGWE